MCNCKTMAIEGPHSLLNSHHVKCEDNKPVVYVSVKEDDEPAIVIPCSELIGFIEANGFVFDELIITKKMMSKTEYDDLPEYVG